MAGTTPKKRPTVDYVIPHIKLKYLDAKPVGSGAFGDVHKAVHEEWGCPVAYKKLDIRHITSEKLVQELKYEAEIHKQLRCPYIVSMLGIVFEPNNYGIVLEYITYGSWTNFLSILVEEGSDMSCIPCILKTKLAQEICSGMSYLHSCSIIHCDLKLQNILITKYLNAKISDFGLSKWKNFSRSHTQIGCIKGTPSHIAPELWSDDPPRPDEKCDVYSFSILLWEMFTEKQAFEGRTDMIAQLVLKGTRLPLYWIPQDVPKEIPTLIDICWTQKPEERPPFCALVAQLRPLVEGEIEEKQIKDAKEVVLATYNKRLSSEQVSDHCQKIERVQNILCASVRKTNQILSSLFQKRVVTQAERDLIQCQTTTDQWATQLLNLLSGKPESAYQYFLEALDATDQCHLHRLLEEEDYVMNVEHRETLLDNFTYLQKNVTLTGTSLLDTLLEGGVLDSQEMEEIKSKTTNHERVDQLLQLILRTSQEQYHKFLDSLNKADHKHVWIKLGGQGRPADLNPADWNQLSSRPWLHRSSAKKESSSKSTSHQHDQQRKDPRLGCHADLNQRISRPSSHRSVAKIESSSKSSSHQHDLRRKYSDYFKSSVNNTALVSPRQYCHMQVLRPHQDDWLTQLLAPVVVTTEPSRLNYVDTEDELMPYFDEENRRLYVGECKGGGMLVFRRIVKP